MNLKIGAMGVLSLLMLILLMRGAQSSDDEERLMLDVFRGYNSLIQPVKHFNDTPIIVKMALQLVLLINVDEKDQVVGSGRKWGVPEYYACIMLGTQIMHTNVWLTLKWHDFQMK